MRARAAECFAFIARHVPRAETASVGVFWIEGAEQAQTLRASRLVAQSVRAERALARDSPQTHARFASTKTMIDLSSMAPNAQHSNS
jgi:hypothetical protein